MLYWSCSAVYGAMVHIEWLSTVHCSVFTRARLLLQYLLGLYVWMPDLQQTYFTQIWEWGVRPRDNNEIKRRSPNPQSKSSYGV
jgi:hypothetical protein